MNRELVMLAKVYNEREKVGGLFVSTKLDGQRCFWDGGVSRGRRKDEIPWANIDKDERYRETQICTGLWSRYGNIIHAPPWFLDQLPIRVLLDGELFVDRGKFQETRTIVSRLEPDSRWENITFWVFDSPSVSMFCQNGKINNPNMTKYADENSWMEWFNGFDRKVMIFLDSYKRLEERITWGRNVKLLPQIMLPFVEEAAKVKMMDMLEEETVLGGEGLMLRYPGSIWSPKRYSGLLKVKKLSDSEGKVIGFYSGLGKLLGLFGSMIVEWGEKRFELSGFTESERTLLDPTWAMNHPGELMPEWCESVCFKRNTLVRFCYRGLTDSGLPREARYMR